MWIISNFDYDKTLKSLLKSMELNEKIRDSADTVSEQKDRLQKILDVTTKGEAETRALDVMSSYIENSNVVQVLNSADSTMKSIQNNYDINTINGMVTKTAIQVCKFESPIVKVFENWSSCILNNLVSGLSALITSPIIQEIQIISSNIGKWLQTVDFSPLISILDSIRDAGFDYDYEVVNEVYLKAMFDAKWFPYAGWIADFRLVDEMLEILNTSRASKNRIKRIDKLIFSFYNKTEINNFKRGWRQLNLPSYMTRILVQSVQAYHRKEYALTVSALSTLWEGIIQEKANDNSYRTIGKTSKNLTKLINKNDFNEIFSSFCDEFIFYNCNNPKEVKPDVPGRHCIAHCWYENYPNRKMALNAIIFTDFLIRLKPLEKTEEDSNGKIKNAQP